MSYPDHFLIDCDTPVVCSFPPISRRVPGGVCLACRFLWTGVWSSPLHALADAYGNNDPERIAYVRDDYPAPGTLPR